MTLPEGTLTARTPEQARLLLDLTYFRTLEEVMRREASAGEVARAAGVTLKRAHHRLTRLVGAGLVQVCGARQRAGRPVRLYRALARSYRVPFALTDAVTVAELIGRMQQPFMAAYARAVAGRLLERHEHADVFIQQDALGQLSVSLSPPVSRGEDRAPALYGLFTQLHLKPAAQKELARQLRDLHAWAEEQERLDPGEEPCILGLLFTPGEVQGL